MSTQEDIYRDMARIDFKRSSISAQITNLKYGKDWDKNPGEVTDEDRKNILKLEAERESFTEPYRALIKELKRVEAEDKAAEEEDILLYGESE